MPKLAKSASKSAKQARMKEEMHKFKAGDLHSGSKSGPIVKDRQQAIAIGLNVSGQSRDQKRKGRKATRSTSRR